MNFNFYKKSILLSFIGYIIMIGYVQANTSNTELTKHRQSTIRDNCLFTEIMYLSESYTPGAKKYGQTTNELGNTYSETDLGDFDNGQDKIYKITIDEADMGFYDIKIKAKSTNAGIALFKGCPSNNIILAKSANNSEEQVLENVEINISGGLYLMVDCKPFESNDVVIYDLIITKKPAPVCKPAFPFVNQIKAKEARVEWNSVQNETKWDLKYEKKGFNPENQGNLIPDVTYPYILKNLEPDTEYDIYLRSKCSETSISEWSPSSIFKTEKDCEIITEYPYLEDFTKGNPSLKCWTIIDANNDGEEEDGLVNGKWEFASNIATYSYSKENNADDWLISPRLNINQALELSFEYRALGGSSNPEKFSVYVIEHESPNNYLSATEILSTTTANSNQIKTIDAISLQNYINKQIYIAIKCESDKDMSSLAIDNFKINKMNIPVETFKLTASVDGIGGSISPAGTTEATKGDTKEFTVKADEGYVLESLIDDGVLKTVDAEGKYILTDIQKDHTIVVKFKNSTSILENSSIELNIYPNPTNDYLNIQASEEIAKIEILSLDGKILDKETINTNRYKYNINYLSEGNYLIRILGKNNITTKQFSVKRQ